MSKVKSYGYQMSLYFNSWTFAVLVLIVLLEMVYSLCIMNINAVLFFEFIWGISGCR
jgi:hypothetical protein